MDRTIYFADKVVLFAAEAPASTPFECVIRLDAEERIGRAKILNFLENQKSILVLSPDPTAAFEAFASEFVPVEAAGGIVVNAQGEWLMIHRNGRWDLPKGHWERGETLEECAAREVGEETGVTGARVVRPLCATLHAYQLRGRWELKRTHWYELRIDSVAPTAPQREEGIDRVQWCAPEEVHRHLAETFPTIRRVAECMAR